MPESQNRPHSNPYDQKEEEETKLKTRKKEDRVLQDHLRTHQVMKSQETSPTRHLASIML